MTTIKQQPNDKINNLKSIYSISREDLSSFCLENKLNKYLANQIFGWIYKKNVNSFNEMTNISKNNINLLKNKYCFDNLKIDKVQIDNNDGTIKFLFQLFDSQKIETVLLKFDYGYSICISSQVGCNMMCKFCASGKIKKIRNLTSNEFILQFLEANKYLADKYQSNISNIVVMGIGEPFDNYDNLMNFLNIIRDQHGIGIGSRKITVSTCGLVNKIKQFADTEKQVNLAISFHAPFDKKRLSLMPINNAFNIKSLLEAIDYYIDKTNNRITIEYILLKDINDTREDALELVKLFKDRLCYINIIPYNKIAESNFKRSEKCKNFYDILKSSGITCIIRQEKGLKIDAACGQLRNKRSL